MISLTNKRERNGEMKFPPWRLSLLYIYIKEKYIYRHRLPSLGAAIAIFLHPATTSNSLWRFHPFVIPMN